MTNDKIRHLATSPWYVPIYERARMPRCKDMIIFKPTGRGLICELEPGHEGMHRQGNSQWGTTADQSKEDA